MPKLPIRIRVGASLSSRNPALEAVAQAAQQPLDAAGADAMAHLAQGGGQIWGTPARPAQRSTAITRTNRMNERLQVRHQREISLRHPLAAAPWPAHTVLRVRSHLDLFATDADQ